MDSTKTTRRDVLGMLCAAGVTAITPASLRAQSRDGQPGVRETIELDNAKVLVLRRTAAPGQNVYGPSRNSDPPRLLVFFTDGKVKAVDAGSAPKLIAYTSGDIVWDGRGAHSVENVGGGEITVFVVEPKGSVPSATTPADRMQWKKTPVLAGGKIWFENDMVRVVEHSARPRMGVCGEGMHTHPPHLTIALTDARIKIMQPDREPVIREGKAGTVFWDDSGPHAIQNLGSRSTRSFLIEIKTV